MLHQNTHRTNSSTVHMQHLVLQNQANGDLASPGEGKTLHVTQEMASQGLQEYKNVSSRDRQKDRSQSCHLCQGRCYPDLRLPDPVQGTPRPHRTAQGAEGRSILLPAGS